MTRTHCTPGSCSPALGHGVDQRCQRRGRVAGQVVEDRRRLKVHAGCFEGRHQVRQEPRQVVVRVVERQPCGVDVRVSLTHLGDPVAEHGGLPEPGGRRHERQAMARIEGGVELFGQSGARDGPRAPGRREQFRGEHRRRHPRIIGAVRTGPVSAAGSGLAPRQRLARSRWLPDPHHGRPPAWRRHGRRPRHPPRRAVHATALRRQQRPRGRRRAPGCRELPPWRPCRVF